VQVVIVSRPRTGSWAWRTDTAFRVAHCRRGTSRRPRSSRSRRRDSWPRAGSSAGNSRRSAADSRADRCTMNRGIAAAERRLGTCRSPECRQLWPPREIRRRAVRGRRTTRPRAHRCGRVAHGCGRRDCEAVATQGADQRRTGEARVTGDIDSSVGRHR